jgi:hypothetical protein
MHRIIQDQLIPRIKLNKVQENCVREERKLDDVEVVSSGKQLLRGSPLLAPHVHHLPNQDFSAGAPSLNPS